MTYPAGFTWVDAERIAAAIDGADEFARKMEEKWGVGRLELLVDDELRVRFRRQVKKFDEAIESHEVERVRRHASGMKKAWETLDFAASASGGVALSPEVWEIVLPDGRVIAFTRSNAEASAVTRSGRYVETWTVAEVARVIAQFPEIATAKTSFPGATVTSVKAKRSQAFDWQTGDEIPF